MTRLAVIDCKTLQIESFDDKVSTGVAKIEIDKETTKEGLHEVIEYFRTLTTAEQAKKDRILNEKRHRADLEVDSWQ